MIRQVVLCILFQISFIIMVRSLVLPVILGYADLLVQNYRRKLNR
jgi:hypothetical protein